MPAYRRPSVPRQTYGISPLTTGAREPFTDRSGRDWRFRYRSEPHSAATDLPPGEKNPGNLPPRAKDRGRLSFWESLDASFEGSAVFLPGDDHIAIDANLLPAGSVVFDNNPPGHVSVIEVELQVLRTLARNARSPGRSHDGAKNDSDRSS